MRTLRSWIGALTGSAILTVGVVIASLTAISFVIFSGARSIDIPGTIDRIVLGSLDQPGETAASAAAPAPIVVRTAFVTGRVPSSSAPTARHRSGDSGPRERRRARVSPTVPLPVGKTPVTNSPAGSSPGGSAPAPAATTASGGGGGGGSGGGGIPLGSTVRDTARQLGNTVSGTTQALGKTLDGVSPKLGDPIPGAGQVLGDTVTGTGQVVGNTLDGLLGSH
jgi:hypothetical protein